MALKDVYYNGEPVTLDGRTLKVDDQGLPEQEKSVTITENGTTEITPDEGKTMSKATVTVNVPQTGGDEETTDVSLGVTGAAVGQIVKITAVDENGAPTEWEPLDMPSGEADEWVQLGTLDASTADTLQLEFAQPMKKIFFVSKITDSAGELYAQSSSVYRTISLMVGAAWKPLNALKLGACKHAWGWKYNFWLDCATNLPQPKGEIFGTLSDGTGTPGALMFIGTNSTYQGGLVSGVKFELTLPDGTENTASGTITVWGVKA